MQPLDLIVSARRLANAPGKPLQANLRRATSTAYYALFHGLVRSAADLFVGGTQADRSKHAWRQIYRALEHGYAKQQCRSRTVKLFPRAVEDFANLFANMQTKRHAADYDPFGTLVKSEVLSDIADAETALKAFMKVPAKDRRAFCAFVMFKTRG